MYPKEKKIVAPYITHLMPSLALLLTISLQYQAVASVFHLCLSSLESYALHL